MITKVDGEISSQDLSVTVTFTADDPEAYFQCKLNNRDFVSCKSQVKLV